MVDAEKMSRKELLKPNRAEKILYSFVDHAYRERRIYTIIAILFVFSILIVWGIWQYMQKERITQANLFHSAISKLNDQSLTEENRLSQGILALNEFARSEIESELSVLAMLESGKAYAKQSKIDESISAFKEVIIHPKATKSLKNSARLSLASLYEDKNYFKEAKEILESIDIESWDDLRWRALARIAISEGDLKRAKRLLEQLLEKFPDSIFISETKTILLTL